MRGAGILVVNELLGEGAVLDALQVVFHALAAVLVDDGVDVVAVLSGVRAGPTSLVQTALVHQVDEHLELVADLEVGDFRLVAGVGQDFEAHLDELVHATHEHVLLAEEIGLGLFLEGGLDGTGAQGTEGLGVGQGQSPAVATRILLDGHDDRHATASGVLTTNDVARALRGNHEHRVILRRLDVAVVNVEAMSERNSSTRLDVGLDVVGPDGALVLVGGQNHDHVGLGGSLGHGLDLEALLLGEVDRLGGRTQADDHVDTGIAKVQRVGVALGAVADDRDLLAVEHGQIAVVLVPDLCCHNGTPLCHSVLSYETCFVMWPDGARPRVAPPCLVLRILSSQTADHYYSEHPACKNRRSIFRALEAVQTPPRIWLRHQHWTSDARTPGEPPTDDKPIMRRHPGRFHAVAL